MIEGAQEDRSLNSPEAKGAPPSSSQESLPAKLGVELIIRFYRLLKAAAFYDRNNIHIKTTERGISSDSQGISSGRGATCR